MNNTNWNDKQQVLASVTRYGYALRYASEELKNNKKNVLVAVNQNGYALEYASEEIQNDLKLLNLLHNFFIFPENKIEDTTKEKQQWFEEHMKIRDILVEQESIPNKGNKKPVQSRSLKF